MVIRSSRRYVFDSFSSSDNSQKNTMLPWCSARKLTEKRKLSPNWEIQSSYPLRKNIYEYLYDKNLKCSKRRNRIPNKHGKRYRRKTVICLILLFITGGMALLWKLYPTPCSKLLSEILPKTRLLTIDWEYSSVPEECCRKMRHLALELSRAERILRNTFRLRMAALSASRLKSVTEKPIRNSRYISGGIASKRGGTEEWSGRVKLWGVVPLWNAAPSPGTVLALRHPTPADCWPFSGSSGELQILLPRIQRVRSISVEHVRPDTANSAPKRFVVYGVLANDTEIEVANSEYRHQGPAKQYYPIRADAPMKAVVFSVLSNHGNLKYTCIYRVHLYGCSETVLYD